MGDERKYQFSWDLLGNIELGRPNLGRDTRIEVYRLMQFCFRDVLEQHYGEEGADLIFYEAGKLAGQQFYRHLIGDVSELNQFVKKLQELLKEFKIGILRIEKENLQAGELVVTVSEDLDCSGLPELDFEICKYDEGFLAGILECFANKQFDVKEIDCWCTGDRTCRFVANLLK